MTDPVRSNFSSIHSPFDFKFPEDKENCHNPMGILTKNATSPAKMMHQCEEKMHLTLGTGSAD
jgi:hypothetical protein